MTGPKGNSELFCFPIISMFLETKLRETLRFEGNKIHCFPRDQSLSDLLYSKKKTKQKQILKKCGEIPVTTSGHFQLHALITCNSGQHFAVTVNCFLFDIIVFAMLPAHGIVAGNSDIVRCHVTMN